MVVFDMRSGSWVPCGRGDSAASTGDVDHGEGAAEEARGLAAEGAAVYSSSATPACSGRARGRPCDTPESSIRWSVSSQGSLRDVRGLQGLPRPVAGPGSAGKACGDKDVPCLPRGKEGRGKGGIHVELPGRSGRRQGPQAGRAPDDGFLGGVGISRVCEASSSGSGQRGGQPFGLATGWGLRHFRPARGPRHGQDDDEYGESDDDGSRPSPPRGSGFGRYAAVGQVVDVAGQRSAAARNASMAPPPVASPPLPGSRTYAGGVASPSWQEDPAGAMARRSDEAAGELRTEAGGASSVQASPPAGLEQDVVATAEPRDEVIPASGSSGSQGTTLLPDAMGSSS